MKCRPCFCQNSVKIVLDDQQISPKNGPCLRENQVPGMGNKPSKLATRVRFPPPAVLSKYNGNKGLRPAMAQTARATLSSCQKPVKVSVEVLSTWRR